MYKIQYNAIVDEFRERGKKMDEGAAQSYMEATVDMLTNPMPGDADEMIQRTEEVQSFARNAMLNQRAWFAMTGDLECRNNAEVLCAIAFGLAMGRAVALSLIGVEEL
jgi:hypothetical protein